MNNIDFNRMFENPENPDCYQDDAPTIIECEECDNEAYAEYEISERSVECNPITQRLCEECADKSLEDGYVVTIMGVL